MKKKLILSASVLMLGLFAISGVVTATTTTFNTSVELTTEDCDKCGKKDCKGSCESKESKKECTTEGKESSSKACCAKKSKCSSKTESKTK